MSPSIIFPLRAACQKQHWPAHKDECKKRKKAAKDTKSKYGIVEVAPTAATNDFTVFEKFRSRLLGAKPAPLSAYPRGFLYCIKRLSDASYACLSYAEGAGTARFAVAPAGNTVHWLVPESDGASHWAKRHGDNADKSIVDQLHLDFVSPANGASLSTCKLLLKSVKAAVPGARMIAANKVQEPFSPIGLSRVIKAAMGHLQVLTLTETFLPSGQAG